jgi:flagellar motor switch protein FliG
MPGLCQFLTPHAQDVQTRPACLTGPDLMMRDPLALPGASVPRSASVPNGPGSAPMPPHASSRSGRAIPFLTGRQKAAVIVRFLLAQGADLPLDTLPETLQTQLAEQMAALRLIDRETLDTVVQEFLETLEQVGLTFPGGIESALQSLDGRLSPGAQTRLRDMARAQAGSDPWARVADAPPDTLIDFLAAESAEVAAVVLSKLSVAKAADLLGRMTGPRARAVAYAVSRTSGVAPDLVARIGAALAHRIDTLPQPVFRSPPDTRIGAILNAAPGPLRDQLLTELAAEDRDFAENVRKSIFTFAHIHTRLPPRDVPRVLREVAQPDLLRALGAALAMPDSPESRSADFLLASISQRMATGLRDEIAGQGRIKPRDGEAAMAEVVAALRGLADAGEITLIEDEEM